MHVCVLLRSVLCCICWYAVFNLFYFKLAVILLIQSLLLRSPPGRHRPVIRERYGLGVTREANSQTCYCICGCVCVFLCECFLLERITGKKEICFLARLGFLLFVVAPFIRLNGVVAVVDVVVVVG